MVLQIIIVLVIIVLGLYVIGVGTDFLSDISASFAEKAKKQAEVQGEGTTVTEVFAKANLAKDTGTRVCDLEIIFVGDLVDFETGLFLIGQGGISGFLGFERFIYFGEPFDPILASNIPGDRDIFEYTWFCDTPVSTTATTTSATTVGTSGSTTSEPVPLVGEGSTGGGEICRTGARGIQICETLSIFQLLSWNLIKNTGAGIEQLQLSLLEQKSDEEIVRVNFIGPSKTRQNFNLYAPDFADLGIEENPFTKSFQLGTDENFPVSYRIKLNLDDVTEDDYRIEFWYDTFPANNEPVGTHFFKDLCRPGSSNC